LLGPLERVVVDHQWGFKDWRLILINLVLVEFRGGAGKEGHPAPLERLGGISANQFGSARGERRFRSSRSPGRLKSYKAEAVKNEATKTLKLETDFLKLRKKHHMIFLFIIGKQVDSQLKVRGLARFLVKEAQSYGRVENFWSCRTGQKKSK